MSTDLPQDERRALMLRHLEGDASADEAHRLSAVLRASADARREYVALVRQHALLFELAEERRVVVLDKPRFETKLKPVFGWRRLAWAAVFAVCAALAIALFTNRGDTDGTPRIASLEGDVVLDGPGGERALRVGERWRVNEVLRTAGRRSQVTLKFSDGSQISFGAETVAENQSGASGGRITLERGRLQAIISKQPAHQPFVFITPHTEVTVVGTTLRLVAEERITRVEVTDGRVRFRRLSDEAEVVVGTGEHATARPEGPLVARPIGEER